MEVEQGHYAFHRRALAALNQLTSEEQGRVLETLATLSDTPPSQWAAEQATRLPGDPPLHLVRVDADLRIILRTTEGEKIEVLDVVRHETLESFARLAGNTG